MTDTFLGIDLGTSGVKVTLVDDEQSLLGSAHAELDVQRPNDGWSEQDPKAWIAATEKAVGALKDSQANALSRTRGIGLAGQMHGATLLDANDRVLRPCLLWNDTRAHAEAALLDADPRFRAVTGNIVFPGFTAPKVEWVRGHEPEVFAATRRVLLPKDYLRLWLTGEYASDRSDASGTAWLDVANRTWSDELLARTGLDVSAMPRLVEGTEPSGQVRKDIAKRWGLPPTTVVAGGAGDNAAAACGMGIVEDGRAFVSLGTSGVLFVATDAFRPNARSAVHAFCHALPDTWHQMGVMLSATDALNWLALTTGRSAAELTASLGDRLLAPGRETFLPYLSGERTPHNDADVRGLLAGIGHATDHAALARAVVEGVAFALRDNLEALRGAGTELQHLVAVGGGARSTYWLKAIATALSVPVQIPTSGELGASFGAARLARLAAGDASADDVFSTPSIESVVEPERALMDAYDAAWERFRALYPAAVLQASPVSR